MQSPPNNSEPPQQAVMGSVAQPQQQSFWQPQHEPKMTGQPTMMQQMPGNIMVGGGFPQTSAQTALILSIVSIFFGGICLAIPALIVANGALAITNQTHGHPDAVTAKAAQVISWIIIGLSLVGFSLLFFAMIFIGL